MEDSRSERREGCGARRARGPEAPPGPPEDPGKGKPPTDHPDDYPPFTPPGPPPEPPGRRRKPKKPFGGQASDWEVVRHPVSQYPYRNPLARNPSVPEVQWWALDQPRWELERQLMAECYPGFLHAFALRHGLVVRVWHGSIRPWPDCPLQATAAIDRLDRDEDVLIRNGTVLPPAEAAMPRVPHSKLTNSVLTTDYRLLTVHRVPPHHPRTWVLSPRVRFPDRHVYNDDAVCPLTPHEDEWSWATHTLVDYLDDVAIWLVKHSFYKLTGNWVGSESQHNPHNMPQVRRNAQCPCASGLPYGECHGKMAMSPDCG